MEMDGDDATQCEKVKKKALFVLSWKVNAAMFQSSLYRFVLCPKQNWNTFCSYVITLSCKRKSIKEIWFAVKQDKWTIL